MRDPSKVGNVIRVVKKIVARGSADPAFDGLRIFGHPERMFCFLTGKSDAITPVTVELWPSLSCNARCPTCPYRLSGARAEADSTTQLKLLDLGLASVLASELAAAGVKSVILTGGGEPLLHPELLHIIDALVAEKLEWAIFTNGFLLTPSIAEALIRRHPRFLRISLDAGTPDMWRRTYALSETGYFQVLSNIRSASEMAAKHGSLALGLGFSLDSLTTYDDLGAIRDVLAQCLTAQDTAIGLVSFRPRLIHYRGAQPVCPQPAYMRFEELSSQINDLVIRPLQALATVRRTKMDVKHGLFVAAGSTKIQKRSLSTSWMTNIDQEGVGFMTAEKAGDYVGGKSWGRICNRHDFQRLWHGERRRRLIKEFESGLTPVPLAHRTSAVDAALNCVMEALGGAVKDELALDIISAVRALGLQTSRNLDFF